MDSKTTKRHDLSDSAWTCIATGPGSATLYWERAEGILVAIGKSEPALSSPDCFPFSRQFQSWLPPEISIWARMQEDALPGSILVIT